MIEDIDEYLNREVFAKFGLAYYYSECIHRQLCNYYVFQDLPSKTATIRPRLEEKMKFAYSMTLGKIYNELKDNFDEDTINQMDIVITKRNYLAHHFWFEKCNMMGINANLEKLIEELNEYVSLFKKADEELTKNYPIEVEKIGVTQEMLDLELEKVLRGEPYEQLPGLRYVKKNEKIVNVWNSPVNNNKTLLIFETDDGILLQLSDIGLSWYYGGKNDNWILNEKFAKYLPAVIVARPEIEKPWNYVMKIENKACLKITKPEDGIGLIYHLKEL